MQMLLNIACYSENLSEYRDASDFEQSFRRLGCDGVEMIDAGQDERNILLPDFIVGLHLSFYPYWIDLWNGNETALMKEFGDLETCAWYYGGKDREALLRQFSADLERAATLHVRYVVFHVSNVNISELFTYRMEHTDEEIIDAAAELINDLMKDKSYEFDFLLENLAWPGFTMTRPELTLRLLSQVNYPRKGIMLDIGHLMNTNIDLESEEEACAYVHEMLDRHGELAKYIKGVHLHQSLSSDYVKQSLKDPVVPTGVYRKRLAQAYVHINQIDRHQPMTCSGTKALIDRIVPEYLVCELAAKNREERERLLKIQMDALYRSY